MQSDYTVLTDHSYSLRPVETEENLVKKGTSASKTKLSRRNTGARSKKSISKKNNRTVSIDRNSSDKENKSVVVSTRKASLTRLSMGGGRKKSIRKPPMPSTASSIQKKKTLKNRKKIRSTEVSSSLLLSIEERVKLRRTKPIPTVNYRKNKSQSMSKKISPVQDDLDQIRQSLKDIPPFKPDESTVQVGNSNSTRTRKSFLGSGLDLDNILLGNRRNRSLQT